MTTTKRAPHILTAALSIVLTIGGTLLAAQPATAQAFFGLGCVSVTDAGVTGHVAYDRHYTAPWTTAC